MDVVVYGGAVDMVRGMLGLPPVRDVEEKCVGCQIGDHCLEWDPPEISFGAPPTVKYRIL